MTEQIESNVGNQSASSAIKTHYRRLLIAVAKVQLFLHLIEAANY